MNKYIKNEIILILIVLFTVISNFLSKEQRIYPLTGIQITLALYILYALFTNKISLWTVVILGILALLIGQVFMIMHWATAGVIFISSVTLQLFIIPALLIEYKKKIIELDVYLLGGFGLILFQNLGLVAQLEIENLEFFNYGVFGMFMTILINKQSYGKMIDSIIIIFIAQSSIFVINQLLSTLL